MVRMILTDPRDVEFTSCAQGARVDGVTLPSGLKVPVTRGKKWIIEDECIRCVDDIIQTNTHGVARIVLTDARDIQFAKIAQGARVDGTVLPSGLRVPVMPGQWFVVGACVRCMYDSSLSLNVPT